MKTRKNIARRGPSTQWVLGVGPRLAWSAFFSGHSALVQRVILENQASLYCCNFWATHFKYNDVTWSISVNPFRTFAIVRWFPASLVDTPSHWLRGEALRCRGPAYWKVCFHHWIYTAWPLNRFPGFFNQFYIFPQKSRCMWSVQCTNIV